MWIGCVLIVLVLLFVLFFGQPHKPIPRFPRRTVLPFANGDVIVTIPGGVIHPGHMAMVLESPTKQLVVWHIDIKSNLYNATPLLYYLRKTISKSSRRLYGFHLSTSSKPDIMQVCKEFSGAKYDFSIAFRHLAELAHRMFGLPVIGDLKWSDKHFYCSEMIIKVLATAGVVNAPDDRRIIYPNKFLQTPTLLDSMCRPGYNYKGPFQYVL